MGQIVIAGYRPRPGREAQLLELVREHVSILRGQGLVTEREPTVMRAGDGTILEVFEWQSVEAIEAAHRNQVVMALWERFNEACEYEAIGNLPESRELFSSFELVDFE
jgi:hypothetical protein